MGLITERLDKETEFTSKQTKIKKDFERKEKKQTKMENKTGANLAAIGDLESS